MTGTPGTTLTPDPSGERHASWLELFFDLVAVAGVAQLAHLLSGEPGWRDVGLYIVLYLAFWTDWMSLTLYGNVAAERTRTRTLLLGMFGLTVMAAAVHGVQEGELGRAFAIAYVTTRALGSRVFGERREVLADWPTVSFTAGAVPWTVSIWVGGPARPWLWTLGVVIDLYVVFVFSRDRLLHNLAKRRQGRRQGRPEAAASGDAASGDNADTAPDTGLTVVHTDTEHLAERLGLFTIIVLGEGVYQLVEAASEAAEWNRELFAAVTGAFALLVLLWSQSLNRGRGGVPGLRHTTLPPRALLGLHCFVTGALAALAAGLGVVVEHADGRLPAQTGWLMAAGLGGYLLVGTLVEVVLTRRTGTGHPPSGLPRLLTAALPALALCAATGATDGAYRHPLPLVWLLVLALAWFAYWTRGADSESRDKQQPEEAARLPQVPRRGTDVGSHHRQPVTRARSHRC
ncbi:low temperature requirement protein A [Streptomyces sp. NPDC094038]|uniref:low temperature requirement protein A n=1 Tax=Streptomyces sp. NPDC094038 TaxID=3366055 RepID=UPI0037F98DEE